MKGKSNKGTRKSKNNLKKKKEVTSSSSSRKKTQDDDEGSSIPTPVSPQQTTRRHRTLDRVVQQNEFDEEEMDFMDSFFDFEIQSQDTSIFDLASLNWMAKIEHMIYSPQYILFLFRLQHIYLEVQRR
jgi:hypothetical protein